MNEVDDTFQGMTLKDMLAIGDPVTPSKYVWRDQDGIAYKSWNEMTLGHHQNVIKWLERRCEKIWVAWKVLNNKKGDIHYKTWLEDKHKQSLIRLEYARKALDKRLESSELTVCPTAVGVQVVTTVEDWGGEDDKLIADMQELQKAYDKAKKKQLAKSKQQDMQTYSPGDAMKELGKMLKKWEKYGKKDVLPGTSMHMPYIPIIPVQFTPAQFVAAASSSTNLADASAELQDKPQHENPMLKEHGRKIRL